MTQSQDSLTPTVAHSNTAEAVVNAPSTITMYAPDGTPVQVDSSAAESMLRFGFSRHNTDPDVALADYLALLPNLAHTWETYLAATKAGGYIDTAAQDTAHEAIRLVANAANHLHLSIHARWNIQGEDEVPTQN